MVDVEHLVDPELEGLLRELGSRPRSVFLRSSRKDAMRVLRSRTTEPVSRLATSDSLERELLTVHRAELAEILKQACRTKLLEGEREKLFIMRYRTATERVDPVPLGSLGARFERARGTGIPDPWLGAIPAIERALSAGSPEEISVLDLAALGQRLQPGNAWRVMSAMASLANGDGESAREMSKAVLDGWPRIEESLRSLEILAISEVIAGNPSRALEFQEYACALCEECLIGQVNRLRYSILCLKEKSTLEASELLELMMDPQHPLIESVNATNTARWRLGEIHPTPEVLRFAILMRSKMGPVARRLTSALQ